MSGIPHAVNAVVEQKIEYPLVIEEIEVKGRGYLFSKGHHSPEAFAAECERCYGAEIALDKVRHEWWTEDDEGTEEYDYFMTMEVNPATPGAFPATHAIPK